MKGPFIYFESVSNAFATEVERIVQITWASLKYHLGNITQPSTDHLVLELNRTVLITPRNYQEPIVCNDQFVIFIHSRIRELADEIQSTNI